MSCQAAPVSPESAVLQRDADGTEFRLDEFRVGRILAVKCHRSVMHCGSPLRRFCEAIFSFRGPGGYLDLSYVRPS